MPLALLLDRDADTRNMYAHFLQQSGFETDEADDGREGLAKAVSYRPALSLHVTRPEEVWPINSRSHSGPGAIHQRF